MSAGVLQASSNASAALELASVDAVQANPETSRLGSLEFNTPYAHEIAALSAVLMVVATVSIALAVKFTQRSSPSTLSDATTQGCVKTGWECAPIMHRLGGRHSYESLQQTDSPECGGRGTFRFSARLDGANGLLCFYNMELQLHSAGEDRKRLDGWQIAIDIVTQTDVECRQTRLQTQLAADDSDDDEAEEGNPTGAVGGWRSEPLEDVLTVRVNQSPTAPMKGQLLIRVLGQRPPPPEWTSHHHHQPQIPMVKLGGANFQLDRIRDPSVASMSINLRDEA